MVSERKRKESLVRYSLDEIVARIFYFQARAKEDFASMERYRVQWREAFKKLVQFTDNEVMLDDRVAVLDHLESRGEFLCDVAFFRQKIQRKITYLPKSHSQTLTASRP